MIGWKTSLILATIVLLSLVVPTFAVKGEENKGGFLKDFKSTDSLKNKEGHKPPKGLFMTQVLVKGGEGRIKVYLLVKGFPNGNYTVQMKEGNNVVELGKIAVEDGRAIRKIFKVEATPGEHEVSIIISGGSINIVTKAFKVVVEEE